MDIKGKIVCFADDKVLLVNGDNVNYIYIQSFIVKCE